MEPLFSGRFWIQTIASTLLTMVVIYAIKKFSTAYQVPVLQELSKGV